MNFSKNESIFLNNSKILVFGAGQITNILIKKLISKGESVICVTDNYFGQIQNLNHRNLRFVSYKDILTKELNIKVTFFHGRMKIKFTKTKVHY